MAYNEDYQDKKISSIITKSDLNNLIWRSLFLQASQNFERMQACGWLFCLLPCLKKIHKNKTDLAKSMQNHMQFINTNPILSPFILGMVTALEENKESRSTINMIKVATMGPLGGIGDALLWMTALPITLGIGCSLGKEGSILGPILFLILFNTILFSLRFSAGFYGYKVGVRALDTLKEKTKKVSHAASIVGVTVIAGLVATMVNLKCTLEFTTGASIVKLQDGVLDHILPGLLPLAFTLLILKLLKKNYSPVKLIIYTIIFGILIKGLGHFFGINILG